MNRFAISLTAALVFIASSLASAQNHGDLFRRLDADHDGRVVVGDIPKEQLTLFKRLLRLGDSNRDGILSLTEFERALTPTRPEKPLARKVENQLPGSDALLLMLVWMDLNADLAITADEVTPEMRPLFDEFVELLNLKDRSRIPIPQLTQQSIQYAGRAARFVAREGIDVEVEMALLSDQQAAYVERLRNSLRSRGMMDTPENATILFSQLDSDGDGNVTAAEVPQQFVERFIDLLKIADRNQDKQLSEQEFERVAERLTSLDANRPSLAETTQRARQLIRRLDRNGDGRLNRQETPPRMSQRFARLDQNGDGQLDQAEVVRSVEILETLRNSARIQPASSAAEPSPTRKPGQN